MKIERLEQLKTIAGNLTGKKKTNALALIELMGSVIEGLDDKPIEWYPDTLKLVQGVSDRSKLPKEAIVGSFVIGQTILPQPLDVIPILTYNTRQYWTPNQDEARMLCSSPNGEFGYVYGDCRKCEFGKFSEEQRAQCNKTITALVITVNFDRIFRIVFAKSNYANGMELKKLIRESRTNTYNKSYRLTAVGSKKAKNVEVINVENYDNSILTGADLEFTKELYRLSKEDRDAQLAGFIKYINDKDERLALESRTGNGASRLVEIIPAAEAAEAAAVNMSNKYEMR